MRWEIKELLFIKVTTITTTTTTTFIDQLYIRKMKFHPVTIKAKWGVGFLT